MGNANAAANLAPAFTTATAAITGAAERSIQRGVARAAALGPDLLRRLSGTSLDRGTELDALAALPPEARDELVERATAGKQVSAAAALKKSARANSAQPAEKTQPAKPIGPTAAAKQEEPDWDLEPCFQDPDDDIDDALEKLQRDWLRSPARARALFLNWLATGWTSPEDRH
jgi:hypothetical protein